MATKVYVFPTTQWSNKLFLQHQHCFILALRWIELVSVWVFPHLGVSIVNHEVPSWSNRMCSVYKIKISQYANNGS